MLDSLTMCRMGKQRHFIKEWRKHRGLNQEQLAERMGVTQSFVSKIENGKQSPDLAFIALAAEVLRCEPADLIMRDPTAPDAIWSIWEQLDAPARDQVVKIATTFKKAG